MLFLLLVISLCQGMAFGHYPPYPLESTVAYATQYAMSTPLVSSTGLNRSDYLDTINGIVQHFRQFQAPNGSIIDPYANAEIQYSTPCFAFGCATAYANNMDASLFPACVAALSSAIGQLYAHACADGHCPFFTKPVIFAYRILSPLVNASVKAEWDNGLENMNPWLAYGFPVNNWGLVGAVGDFLRTAKQGFSNNYTWWSDMIDFQLSGEGQGPAYIFTPNGLYQDHTGMAGLNPLPYDTFPSSGYLTVMLEEGYNGTHAPFLREMMRRAALTHLLMQSPWGEIPTGGRSSQHEWNEAVSALAYEIWSSWSFAAGDQQSACMFKRAARLAHASVRRWQNPTGELQIVKNHVNASLRWGYEEYSFISNYNLLPAAMLSAAFMYSNDDTEALGECSTFADVGGYVFQLPEHHLIIANAGGVYTEIETASDPNYDSTGLHRVHINTCGTISTVGGCSELYALLGPTASPPQGEEGVAVGPWWALSDNPEQIISLANQSYLDVAGVTLTPAWNTDNTNVAFSVEYALVDQGVTVTESYTLQQSPAQIKVTSSVVSASIAAKQAKATTTTEGAPALPPSSSNPAAAPGIVRFGVTFPALLWDGAINTTVALSAASNSATITGDPSKASEIFSVIPIPGRNFTWSFDETAKIVSRNGLLSTIRCEVECCQETPATPSVSFTLTPAIV